MLAEINSCWPVIVKQERLDTVLENFEFDEKKHVDIKVQDDVMEVSDEVEDEEKYLSLNGEGSRKRRATQPIVVGSSDSADHDDNSDESNSDDDSHHGIMVPVV